MSMKIIIVGGVAGGASAAAKARRTNESADITIFERGPYVSFANCGLPYYVGETITDRDELLLQTPDRFWKRFKVRVHVQHEVIEIHRKEKCVRVKNLVNQEITSHPYDTLILAPGAGAIVPKIPGIQAKNIFSVKTVPDSDKIKSFLHDHPSQNALVIGGGFIGLEAAEALAHIGLAVSIIEKASEILPPFDQDMARLVAHHVKEKGINIITSDGIAGFHKTGECAQVRFSSLDSKKLLENRQTDIAQQLERDIDYREVRRNINSHAAESREYLSTILSS